MTLSVVYSNFCGMVVSDTRNGVESDYVYDTLDSTIGLLNSAGTMTDRWEYWPYGEVISHTGSSVTPLTFLGVIGYFQDVASKLSYVRARHLRVDLARWLTIDPTWPSEPAYMYASNAPITFSDKWGTIGSGSSLDPNPGCVKCSTLISGNNPDIGPLLTCLSRSGYTPEGIQSCLGQFGGDLSNQEWDNIVAYLSCLIAAATLPGAHPGCDQCKSAGADPQYCCHQNFLKCLLTCTGKKGATWALCIEGCGNKFKGCGFAHTDGEPF